MKMENSIFIFREELSSHLEIQRKYRKNGMKMAEVQSFRKMIYKMYMLISSS